MSRPARLLTALLAGVRRCDRVVAKRRSLGYVVLSGIESAAKHGGLGLAEPRIVTSRTGPEAWRVWAA
jgi:hypothetical protein